MLEDWQIKAAKKIQLPSLLPEDTRIIKKGANKYMAICSFHEETTPSMSLVQYENGDWGYRCFGCGATGDPIKYVQKTQGLDFVDAVKLLTKESKSAPARPRVMAEYNYQDIDGNLLYQVLRYEPKAFRVRQMTKQGWVWCLDGIRSVLYRLPEIASKKDATIYYVEGEKDVETLRKHGLLATTHRGGANSFRPELLECLPGKRKIVVIPDRDEPGMALMRKVFAAGRDRGHEVGFCLLPSPKKEVIQGGQVKEVFEVKDVTDWFESGRSLEDMLKEVK